ncbi:MAG: hypothetical protein Q4A15_03685 [Prevotellaceae bacterium]|nr:hypothetical protein [Prevotellaceae bacterium]
MADRTHFYKDLHPSEGCSIGCQYYDSEKDELHYCQVFEANIPSYYFGDQNPLTKIDGKCLLQNRRKANESN